MSRRRSSRPASSRPALSRPASSRPASSRPALSRPASSRPASSRPASSRPALSRPASSDLRAFLPMTFEELEARGWLARDPPLDILLVTGDAYVDHPAFGVAVIGRLLEARGYRVGIVAQPAWDSPAGVARLGRPRLFAGVTAGNLDSMLNALTAQRKVRSTDAYSPGGRAASRPKRASIVYANLLRQAFPGLPIILGGIEASLRRLAHYDYWSDTVRRSILLDAKADLLLFGMAERAVGEVADRLAAGEPVTALRDLRGSAFALGARAAATIATSPDVEDGKLVRLPSYEEVRDDPVAFSRMSRRFALEMNPGNARPLVQVHGARAVYLNPPAEPLDTAALDALYALPFTRRAHWSYGGETIPALETVKHSIVTTRGCFGGCTFCSIAAHEGRKVQSRSLGSVLREVRTLRDRGDFHGTISDVGGPTANMYRMGCESDRIERACRRRSCLYPKICNHLVTDHGPLIALLRALRREEGIHHVFIASGIRMDLAAGAPAFIDELATHHVGGQLSVAPEHIAPVVLDAMHKPGPRAYEHFAERFTAASQRVGKEQYLIPYFISGHPGSTLATMIDLALYLKARGLRPRQVQDFIPTPMSLATSMYYTGLDPLRADAPVYVARGLREKKLQKALLLYWDPAQHDLAREALRRAGRVDLIGRAPSCLVPPP